MQELKFKEQFISQILSGEKTQTRRPYKGEKAKYSVGETVFIKTDSGDIKLFIVAVALRKLHTISYHEIKKEGFDFYPDFLNCWDSIYKNEVYRSANNPSVFVYKFLIYEEDINV